MVYLIIGGILVYVLTVVVVNRNYRSSPLIEIPVIAVSRTAPLRKDTRLTIVSWNLGYAGLGERANFVADGGQDFLPHSKEYVVENAEGIAATVDHLGADCFFLQELAAPSLVNRQTDLQAYVRRPLVGMSSAYSPDIKTRMIPYPLNLDIGTGTFSRFQMAAATAELLPLEGFYFGTIRKNYRMLICRVPIHDDTAELVLVNVHLAAFDEKAQVRLAQLKSVRERMTQEYRNGNFVIVGGDWNLRLVETHFPHTTDEQYMFWLADLPSDFVPQHWTLAADDQAPSVRLVHEAYAPGDTYTCVIDGFLLSPNVGLVDVQNVDLRFRHSDHQPVRLQVVLDSN